MDVIISRWQSPECLKSVFCDRTYKKLQNCTVNPRSTPGLCSFTSNGFRPSLCYRRAYICNRSGSECRSDQTRYMRFWASDIECKMLRSDMPPLLLLYSYVCLQPFSRSSTRSKRISLMVASAVKRFVTKHVCRARSSFSTLNRLTPLFAWPSTTPSGSPLMACSVISIPCLLADPMIYFRWKVSDLA
jgi:hypothetical protein